MMRSTLFALAAGLVLEASPLPGQYPPGHQYSPNVHVMSHVPLGGSGSVMDIEIEQELARPYVYVARSNYGAILNLISAARNAQASSADFGAFAAAATQSVVSSPSVGFDVITVKDPTKARVIYRWRIENQELHRGIGGTNNKYFKVNSRYYNVFSMQFMTGGPDVDLGAIVFDVTGLPDTSTLKEVGRIRVPEIPGGFHNIYAYKHSTGRTLLFATVNAPLSVPYGVNIYDMEKFLARAPDYGLVGHVPLPEPRGAASGYHDAYVAYDPVTKQDKFYGGGPETSPLGGDYVFDVTDIANPKLLASIVAQASMQSGGHTFVATPDGRYGLTIMTSPAHQPVRFWDLKPALDGKQLVIGQPIGEWTPDARKSSHMIEIRWPYAFIAAYEDGMQVIDMRYPWDPVTVGFYDTYNYRVPYEGGGVANGAFGIDVRNADGLIVVPDMQSGFWAFKMDGFDGWNGHDWGMPNASSAQDWDNGPDGGPKPVKAAVR